MHNSRQDWMRQAIALAVENVRLGRGGPFGALVVKENRIIAMGANSVTLANDPTAHAEIVAIRSACQVLDSFELTDCEIYSSCEPCPMCLGAIFWARPTAYYFACTRECAAQAGFDDAFIYDQLTLSPQQRSIPGHCLLPEAGLEAFAAWDHSAQKVRY